MRRETSRPKGPPRDVGEECSPSASQHLSQVSRLSYSPEIREAQTQRLRKLKSSLAKSGEHLQTVALLYSTSPGGGLDPDRSTGDYTWDRRDERIYRRSRGEQPAPGPPPGTAWSSKSRRGRSSVPVMHERAGVPAGAPRAPRRVPLR